MDLSPWMLCGLGAALVFTSTTAGALPAPLARLFGARAMSLLLGSSAGVMLGASLFSLLLPAMEIYKDHGFTPWQAVWRVGFVLLLGALALALFHRILPHEHFLKGAEGASVRSLSRQWLMVLAVALHNVPEGVAVGIGLGSGDLGLGTSVTTAIALQDFPEGLVVAAGLSSIGLSFPRAFTITAITGLLEALGVLVGFSFISVAQGLLPIALAMCAGAMLFVVSQEMIPESHGHGFESLATAGVLGGFTLMMILDVGLS